MNNTTGETKVGRRWNPVAKHDHNKRAKVLNERLAA